MTEDSIQTNNAALKIKGARTTTLLGFMSLIGCVFYAVPGMILAVIGIISYRRCKAIYIQDPVAYERSFLDARVGFIVSVVGLVLSIITFIWTLSLFWPIWFGENLF